MIALMSSHNRRFSPWVLAIIAVIIIALFALGGGLVNGFYSCLVNVGITTTSCSLGAYQAGLAFLSLGSLASFSWFILLIIFFVWRPPAPPVQYGMHPAPGHFGSGNNFAPIQQPQPQPQVYYGGQPPRPQYGAQGQYPAPVVPAKEGAYVTTQPLQQNPPVPPYPIQELEALPAIQSPQYNDKRCGRCEAIVNSSVCTRCGSAVAAV